MQSITDFIAAQAAASSKDFAFLTGFTGGSEHRWAKFSPLFNEDQLDAIQGAGLIVDLSEAPAELATAQALTNFMIDEDIQLIDINYTLIERTGHVTESLVCSGSF